MSQLTASQFIYTRVEPNFSAENRSGYQMVYKSRGLMPQDISAVEQRIQCYRPGVPSSVRNQFFPLPSGAFALVRSKVIPTDSTINDKDGRSGVFLAHGLVFGRDDLGLVDFLPFPIFDHFRFVDSAQDMVRNFGQATGLAPSVWLETGDVRATPVTSWRSEEVRRLVGLALHAQQITASGRSVQMVGEQSDIDDALRVAFTLLPKELRPPCSFDTCIDSCMTPPGLFWAVGSTFRDTNNLFTEVDAKNRRVTGTLANLTEPSDLYFTWLQKALTLGSVSEVLQRARGIQHITSSFANGDDPGAMEIDDQAIQAFLSAHEATVRRAFRDALRTVTDEHLATLWQDDLWNLWPRKVCLAVASSRRVPIEAISAFASDWLQAGRRNLPDSDWSRLRDMARSSGNALLLFFSAVLGNKPNDAVRQDAIRNMDAATFDRAMALMPDRVAPSYYVTEKRLPQLLKNPALMEMSKDQFVGLVEAIANAGYGSQLSLLNDYVGNLDGGSLSRIEKVIRKNPRIAQDFQATIERRRKQVGEPAGLFGRIKSRLPGGPNDH